MKTSVTVFMFQLFELGQTNCKRNRLIEPRMTTNSKEGIILHKPPVEQSVYQHPSCCFRARFLHLSSQLDVGINAAWNRRV